MTLATSSDVFDIATFCTHLEIILVHQRLVEKERGRIFVDPPTDTFMFARRERHYSDCV